MTIPIWICAIARSIAPKDERGRVDEMLVYRIAASIAVAYGTER